MARKPLISYLSEAETESMVKDAMRILEDTGAYVPNEKAKKLLKEAGAKEKPGDVITMPEPLVRDVLGRANHGFNLYDQTGRDFLQVEVGNTFYGPGSDLRFQVDMETEKPEQTRLADVARNITLLENLKEFDFLMSTGLPCDVEPEEIYKEVFKAMVTNSNKPIITSATNMQDIEKIHEVALKVAGSEQSLREKPFFAAYLEPVSPLKIEEDIAERIMFCSENDVPMLFAAGSNIAVHSPGSPESSVIQGTAESLAGLVLAYQANENVKFIFGANSAGFDGNQGIVAYGAPEWPKTMAYYTEIARKLNLPVWGTGGSTDSNELDTQAGFEAALSLFMAEMIGATIVHDVGYLSHGDMTDPRAYVMNSEIIKRVRYIAERGALVPGDALKVVDDVFTGKLEGGFLASRHTIDNYKTRFHPSKWVDRNFLDDKQPTLKERLKQEVYAMLEQCPAKMDEEIVSKRGEREAVQEKIEVQKEKSIDDFFKDFENPKQLDDFKAYLEHELKDKKPDKVFFNLVDSLSRIIKGEDIAFQLAYGEVFNDVSTVVTSRMESQGEGEPFVIGTAENDLHDIGKNLVGQLVNTMGDYKVIDTGINSKTGELIYECLENNASLMGISSLLTTTRLNMAKTIKVLQEFGLKDQIGMIVGGAVIDEAYAKEIGADAYRRSADEAANGLDNIKQAFMDKRDQKSVSLEDFVIIGESLNSISPKVREAMESKDKGYILKRAERQLQQGAKELDVAVSQLGDLKKQQEAIEWIVGTLQEAYDVPLCLDSDDFNVLEPALEAYSSKKPALINSATLDPERKENMVRLANKHNARLVFQAAEGKDADEKFAMVEEFLKYANSNGIPESFVFVDPGLESLATKEESAKVALKTISMLKDKHPELQYTVGLTNIGFGLAKMGKTKALQQAFLGLGRRVGLNSAIASPNILKADFKDKAKVLGESIDFIAGIENKAVYATKLKNEEYMTV